MNNRHKYFRNFHHKENLEGRGGNVGELIGLIPLLYQRA